MSPCRPGRRWTVEDRRGTIDSLIYPPSESAGVAEARQLAAIMFTDIAGFTGLTQSDEPVALQLVDELETMALPIFGKHHGRKVKSMGDGLLVEFPDALDAVQCAIDLQQTLHERNERLPSRPLRLRIGLHLGDVQRRGDDILGDAVNLASRVEPLAEPGGVCLSGPIADQVRNKVPYRLEKLGTQKLRGIQDPVDLYRVMLPWMEVGPSPSTGGPPRLAILPLSNISPDAKDEYFADGLTEELISVLSRIQGLRVIARTSVSQYKQSPRPIRQVGYELGVGSVLEGSVRRAGDRLRITLQLIDVATEEHRWAQTYDRKMSDVFEIQAEVAESTAASLRLELLGTDKVALRKFPTRDLGAYELYLRGVVAFTHTADRGWSREGIEEAARLFRAAIDRDPKFAGAHAYLANLYIAGMGETLPKSEVAEQVGSWVATAYRLDPNEPEVRTARGNYALQLERNWARAEEEFRAAIALNPSAMSAHAWLGILLFALGRFPEAVREFRVTLELDPLFRNPVGWLMRALERSGDAAGALAEAEKMIARDPADRHGHLHRAGLLEGLGRRDEALQELALAEGPAGGSGFVAVRAELKTKLGDPSEARNLVRGWEEGAGTMYMRPNYIAALYAALGDKEKALDLLEKDSREGEQSLWIDFRRHAFDEIRTEPRFLALLKEMNLPP
jgi:adenylate cyclase